MINAELSHVTSLEEFYSEIVRQQTEAHGEPGRHVVNLDGVGNAIFGGSEPAAGRGNDQQNHRDVRKSPE